MVGVLQFGLETLKLKLLVVSAASKVAIRTDAVIRGRQHLLALEAPEAGLVEHFATRTEPLRLVHGLATDFTFRIQRLETTFGTKHRWQVPLSTGVVQADRNDLTRHNVCGGGVGIVD